MKRSTLAITAAVAALVVTQTFAAMPTTDQIRAAALSPKTLLRPLLQQAANADEAKAIAAAVMREGVLLQAVRNTQIVRMQDITAEIMAQAAANAAALPSAEARAQYIGAVAGALIGSVVAAGGSADLVNQNIAIVTAAAIGSAGQGIPTLKEMAKSMATAAAVAGQNAASSCIAAMNLALGTTSGAPAVLNAAKNALPDAMKNSAETQKAIDTPRVVLTQATQDIIAPLNPTPQGNNYRGV